MKDDYLKGIVKQFQYYKLLGEKTFEQLSEQDLNWKYNDESNSITTITDTSVEICFLDGMKS